MAALARWRGFVSSQRVPNEHAAPPGSDAITACAAAASAGVAKVAATACVYSGNPRGFPAKHDTPANIIVPTAASTRHLNGLFIVISPTVNMRTLTAEFFMGRIIALNAAPSYTKSNKFSLVNEGYRFPIIR